MLRASIRVLVLPVFGGRGRLWRRIASLQLVLRGIIVGIHSWIVRIRRAPSKDQESPLDREPRHHDERWSPPAAAQKVRSCSRTAPVSLRVLFWSNSLSMRPGPHSVQSPHTTPGAPSPGFKEYIRAIVRPSSATPVFDWTARSGSRFPGSPLWTSDPTPELDTARR